MASFLNKTVYQIYVKSFRDSNGDGLGDLGGIIEKFGYLQDLGVDYLWLTPFFRSPLNDNGYDVADYYAVDPRFGSMADVETLIDEAGKRGMGLMFDMVFNHTSTEHEWFQKALAGNPKYQDYYIFRDGAPDTPPTNWLSKFGGSAWEYVPHLKKWYLHLFDKTQADLNWDNPAVREELKNVIRFWKDKGVRGFRFDVVNLISKPALFEDDDRGDGRRFYTDGPHVHEYLKELVADTGIEELPTVGEMSSTSLENCVRYTTDHELSMVFSFHHLKVDYKNGDKWELQPVDLGKLRRLFTDWQLEMQRAGGCNALFLCNHDQPRAVSRFGDDKRYRKESAKMLAACTHLMRGTPYIYQGEELGITNAGFTEISQYRDVESLNYYQIMLDSGKTKEEALEILRQRSRDNGRTPMQWDGGAHAGFSENEPWLGLPTNYRATNAAAALADDDSILAFYKRLIALRKENRLVSEGKIEFLPENSGALIAYRRTLDGQSLTVVNNMTGETVTLSRAPWHENGVRILGNYPDTLLKDGALILRPYETLAYQTES